MHHAGGIRRLRADGYTLAQVCDWLRSEGIEITVAGVSAFLRRQEAHKRPSRDGKAKRG